VKHTLECIECGTRHSLNERAYVCTKCGGLLEITFAELSEFDPKRWSTRPIGVWRYRELLPIDEKTEVVFDTGVSSADFAGKVLPAELLETQVAGDKTGSTTGTKTIGDKAKGSVKIQNGTASNINLAAGTVLISSGDLRFSTNSSASVSAALSPSQPGTATVDVTATDIGSQYNLAKDESFKVSNYPKAEVDAVVISDFSGGSSREISAVSEDDQEALEEELTNELLEKGVINAGVTVSPDEQIVRQYSQNIKKVKPLLTNG